MNSSVGHADAAKLLADLSDIRVDVHDDARRVPYKYVVLLWAISKASSTKDQHRQRFRFQDVSRELSALLKPFQVSASPPNPSNPWFALKETPQWWDLTLPNTGGLTYKQTRALNLEGGLSEDAFSLVVGDADFASRAVETIVGIIGGSPEVRGLLTKLTLDTRRESNDATSAPARPPVIRKIGVENHFAEDFSAEYAAIGKEDRTRSEAKLQAVYEDYLRDALQHDISRHEILIDGHALYTDLYDDTTDDLIEVKSSIDRNTMRLALGQILDYARFLKPARCTVLVPEEPAPSIIDLFHDHGVRITWRDGDAFISSRSTGDLL